MGINLNLQIRFVLAKAGADVRLPRPGSPDEAGHLICWYASCSSPAMRSFTSILGTEPSPIQDNLPAEILRELQVEELWARRNVLAELMNEERLALYSSRRALLCPARLKAPDVPWRDRCAGTSVTVVPIRGRKVSL